MPGRRERAGARRRGLQWWIAGAVCCALVATVAVIAKGYDARETPREEPGVWVARESGQYGRVNTDTGELDLVRKVSDPSGVLQVGERGAVLSNANGRAWPLDAAHPVDLGTSEASGSAEQPTEADASGGATPVSNGTGGGAASAVRMPDGIRDLVSAGRFVAVRTEAGAVYVGELAPGGAPEGGTTGVAGADAAAIDAGDAADLASRLESLQRIDPLADGADGADGSAEPAAEGAETDRASDEEAGYQATAIALTDAGLVGLYSADAREVRRYDLTRGEFVPGAAEVPAEASRAATPQFALVDDAWVLLDPDTGELWRERGGGVSLEVEGAPRLQASGGEGAGSGVASDGSVLVADSAGLIRVSADGGSARELEARGTPAQPVFVGGVAYAAWLGQNSGTLWSSEGGDRALRFDDAARETSDLVPVFRSNGVRAVLNETRTGMLWTLPDGELIPLSQWSISDPPKEDRGTVVVEDVTEQVPPVAVADEFGVRPGASSPLPVLLNDFDPNKRDVLTIVPESLSESGLDGAFGSVQLMPDGQSMSVAVSADASGSASFTYRVTDGALVSEPATVTLTAVADDVNTAPAWCPVQGCQREWRVPAMAPGGTLIAQVLDGWVDPEGDVMSLAGVEVVRDEDPVRAIVTADGRLAVRHTDPNAGASETAVRVLVRDGRGEEAQRELQIAVQPDATPEFTSAAATIQVGRAATVTPLDRVAGGSGSYELLDAAAPNGGVTVTPRPATGAVDLAADQPGTATVTVTVRDTVTSAEITGQLRVTATPEGPPLALPPLRAFVRPLADTTVEVLDAIPDAGTRALAVESATVADGELQADVIDHAQVRVAGATADGAPGRIGAVDVTVAEGETRAHGRLTVFQVPESGGAGAIAVADTASVRAGSVVDIPVLDNDVAAPGERLLLHPGIVGSGERGELAFASGNVLRYLAPEKPGTYRLSYTAYGASDPTAGDLGAVIVQVLPPGANRDPEPPTVTTRVSPGASSDVRVPLSGADPDGDRLTLVSVDSDGGAGISAELNRTGTGIRVTAGAGAKAGAARLAYTVRDNRGGTGTGALTVVVVPGEDPGSLIAVTDELRLTPGSEPAVIMPAKNDIDPADGRLTVTSVVPNVAGDEGSREYREAAERLDLSQLKQGRVAVKPGEELGTTSYRYTVRSAATKSTAIGLIVVRTSERVGAQAPVVEDTVLNVRERADLSGDGVDVTSGKVQWATGDVSKLRLSLWGGSDERYRVTAGSRITGEYLPEGDTVVFRLSGTDVSGEEVSTYGLLQVPPLDDLRLTLRAGLDPLSVDENGQTETGVNDLVDVGPGDRVELRRGAFATGRPQASCEAVSEDRLRYTAGREAPWTDTCLIEARLVGQKRWTALSVPVTIVPKEPVVQAAALTRAVAPGSTERIDLADMVTWQGGRAGDASRLRFEVSGGSSLFEVSQSGGSLQVSARADAVPGSQEVLSVSVSGAGESRAPLTLRVGQAPRDLPSGATVALRCTVGSACQTQLVGVAGEHDPFAGKQGGGLKLVAVNGAGCTFGSFSRVGDSGVSVSWPGGRDVGGTCKVGFTVRDAQGRTGEGVIEFDAQGLPSRPSIQQTGYTRDSATFTVALSGRPAHPAVTSVVLSGGGSTSCSAAGAGTYQCVASGLVMGEKHQFTAQAVNAVGTSESSTAVTAWAYAAPETPTVAVEPIKDRQNTDQTRGGVRVTVSGSRDTKQFAISYRGQDGGVIGGPTGSREYPGLEVGSVTFTATPVTRFDVPDIGGGSGTGSAGSGTGSVIGAPRLEGASLASTGENSAQASALGAGPHAGESITQTFSISKPYRAPESCFRGGQESGAFTDLRRYRVYTAMVCLQSEYGNSSATSNPAIIGGDLPAPSASYTVGPLAKSRAQATAASYELTGPEVSGVEDGATVLWSFNGGPPTETFALDENVVQTVQVRQCFVPEDESTCSAWGDVSYTGAPTLVNVAATDVCYDASANPQPDPKTLLDISAAAEPYAVVTQGIPVGTTMPLTITWNGGSRSPFAGLLPTTINVCYTPPSLPGTGTP